jgi:hypothetical protein
MSIDLLRKLREAKMPEAQAEAIAQAIDQYYRPPDMATKSDVGEVKSEIANLKAEIHKEFAVFQRTMILWTAGIVFVGLVAHHLMR